MKLRSVSVLAAAALLLSCTGCGGSAAGPALPNPAPESSTAPVPDGCFGSAVIRDENGAPVEDAQFTITNEAGEAVFSGTGSTLQHDTPLPDGSYTLTVEAEGFLPYSGSLALTNGRATGLLTTIVLVAVSTDFTWAVQPALQADDILPCPAAVEAHHRGWFYASDYAVFQSGGAYGVLRMDGTVVIQAAFSGVRGELDGHIVLLNAGDTEKCAVFCTKTGTVSSPADNFCYSCDVLSTTYLGSDYVFDRARGLLAYVPDVGGSERSVWGQTGSAGYGLSLEEPVTAIAAKFPSDLSDQKATVSVGKTYGAVKKQSVIADFIYEQATDYCGGIAALCKDGKWGYIDGSGKTILPFAYDGCMPAEHDGEAVSYPFLPSDGCIALNSGGQAGYCDLTGKTLLPLGTFAAARPAYEGKAWVKDATTGRWGVIELPERPQEPVEDEPVVEPEEPQQTWQEAYAEVLEGFDRSCGFSLRYVDNDEVPELIIHPELGYSYHAATDITLCSWYDGTVYSYDHISLDGYNCFVYFERKGYVETGYMNQGYSTTVLLSLKNGQLTPEMEYYDTSGAEEKPTITLNGTDYSSNPEEAREIFFGKLDSLGEATDECGDYLNTPENRRLYILEHP